MISLFYKLRRKKAKKKMLKHLEQMVGEWTAGELLAILLDSLTSFVDGFDERPLLSIEIKYNGANALVYNFKEKEYECKNKA